MCHKFLTGEIHRFKDLQEATTNVNYRIFRVKTFDGYEFDGLSEKRAVQKGCTPAQLALSWLLAQGEIHELSIVPIPGLKRRKYLEQNVAALEVILGTENPRGIDEDPPHGNAYGQPIVA